MLKVYYVKIKMFKYQLKFYCLSTIMLTYYSLKFTTRKKLKLNKYAVKINQTKTKMLYQLKVYDKKIKTHKNQLRVLKKFEKIKIPESVKCVVRENQNAYICQTFIARKCLLPRIHIKCSVSLSSILASTGKILKLFFSFLQNVNRIAHRELSHMRALSKKGWFQKILVSERNESPAQNSSYTKK